MREEASLNTLRKINANENDRLMDVANAVVSPILAGNSAESENLLSGSPDAYVGLAVASATPALALAQ